MEPWNTQTVKVILRGKKGWKDQLPRLQTILQSYSKKNSVSGTETDTYISAREQRAQNQTHTLMLN